MTLQLHEIKAPVPKNIEPGNLSQWAIWYTQHLINGGKPIGKISLNGCSTFSIHPDDKQFLKEFSEQLETSIPEAFK